MSESAYWRSAAARLRMTDTSSEDELIPTESDEWAVANPLR